MNRPRVVFLVNGEEGGAMGIRAKSFAVRLGDHFDIRIAYRTGNKIFAIARFLTLLLKVRPEVCYVFDMGFSGVLGASLYRAISRCRMVTDTGDAIYELSSHSGNRAILSLWLTWLLENLALRVSDRIVVRSHPHQALLSRQGITASVIPDGVDLGQFQPQESDGVRAEYGLERVIVIGVLGSLVWNTRWQMCYGWELIEVLDRLRDLPVKGLIVGEGSGLSKLRAQCLARGLENRITFVGRIPYNRLPSYLNAMDVCLSTQTNDIPGQVRTTGKLPLYLACGRFVLASKVGEAARVLPPEMLVPYEGTKDDQYPSRIVDRLRWLIDHPKCIQTRATSVAIAQAHFDYNVLSDRLRQTIRDLLGRTEPRKYP